MHIICWWYIKRGYKTHHTMHSVTHSRKLRKGLKWFTRVAILSSSPHARNGISLMRASSTAGLERTNGESIRSSSSISWLESPHLFVNSCHMIHGKVEQKIQLRTNNISFDFVGVDTVTKKLRKACVPDQKRRKRSYNLAKISTRATNQNV